MPSLRFLVALLFGLLLAFGIRPSSSMPIEGDSKDNEVVQGDDDKTKIDSEKLASEPQKEVKEAQAIDETSKKADSDSVKDEEDGQKGQNEEEQPETVEDIDADVPPPLDSDTQRSDSAAQENENPPIDETKQMAEAQSKYAADQQQEKALAYLANTRQSGVFSAPSQRAIICKDTIQKISCPPEHRIRVLNADFGDMGDVGCLKENNPMPVGFCRTPGTYEKVKKRCDGLEGCDLAASNDWFGDACPDANKYLDVNYDCIGSFDLDETSGDTMRNSEVEIFAIVSVAFLNFVFAAPSLQWYDLWKYHSKPNEQVPYPAPPAAGFSQASYQPPPAPAAYAPAPYAQPPPAYAPGMGVPDLMSSSPYMAPPDPCSPCNTCAQCSLPVCSPCTHTCQPLTCAPRIPASLQPLWQQWNERTADMSRMEMAALIISPLPKLAAPTKAPESAQVSGGAEGSESASGETTSDLDEDALYEASKRSKIQQVKSKQTAKKVTLATHKKAHKDDSEQGFLRSSDFLVSSGDASSGSSS
ncbi:hypothetical protein pdam_00008166 [Pocillopora damicornis]|uniref:SUEL-type lectin domain-containing protein n=1 Tax=Pocillopora damicornis TaxID=46731 RepID=A0A3M6TC88_POCDA|nr:hypothetical protein pdam_00008166 [Pocillopora damicornis]